MHTTCTYDVCDSRSCLDCADHAPGTVRYLVTVAALGTAHSWMIDAAPTPHRDAVSVAAAIGRQRFGVITGLDARVMAVSVTPVDALPEIMFGQASCEILTDRERLELGLPVLEDATAC